VQKGMSAVLPIATAKADICPGACLLSPRKRTYAAQTGMSAKGHKRTSHSQHFGSNRVRFSQAPPEPGDKARRRMSRTHNSRLPLV
jgi:hypothetical protein